MVRVLPTSAGNTAKSGLVRAAAFAEFASSVLLHYKPVGWVDGSVIKKIVCTLWRIRRLPRIEAGQYLFQRFGINFDGHVVCAEATFRERVNKATETQHEAALHSAPAEDRPA
jgi:hypothetical protein